MSLDIKLGDTVYEIRTDVTRDFRKPQKLIEIDGVTYKEVLPPLFSKRVVEHEVVGIITPTTEYIGDELPWDPDYVHKSYYVRSESGTIRELCDSDFSGDFYLTRETAEERL